MFKKIMGLTTVVILVLGIATISVAKFYADKLISSPVYEQTYIVNDSESYRYYDMIKIMKDTNFNDKEDVSFKSMDDFMENIPEKDYQKMIDSMRELNPEMVEIMEGVDREQMIQMHNSMRDTGGCHKNNNSDEFSETKTTL